MERKIGDIFDYLGTKLEVVESSKCDNCYFHNTGCLKSSRLSITGYCVDWLRSDHKCVSFSEIK